MKDVYQKQGQELKEIEANERIAVSSLFESEPVKSTLLNATAKFAPLFKQYS